MLFLLHAYNKLMDDISYRLWAGWFSYSALLHSSFSCSLSLKRRDSGDGTFGMSLSKVMELGLCIFTLILTRYRQNLAGMANFRDITTGQHNRWYNSLTIKDTLHMDTFSLVLSSPVNRLWFNHLQTAQPLHRFPFDYPWTFYTTASSSFDISIIDFTNACSFLTIVCMKFDMCWGNNLSFR